MILDVYEILSDVRFQGDHICKPWIATSDSMILWMWNIMLWLILF